MNKTLANMEFQILDRNLKLLNKQGKYFISTSNHKLPLKENVSNRTRQACNKKLLHLFCENLLTENHYS